MTRGGHTPWCPTPAQLDELRRLAASGFHDGRLSEHFNVPRTTIEYHRRNNKIPNGYTRPIMDEPPEGFAEIAPTLTKAACAKQFNVSTTTVRRWYIKTGTQAAERDYGPGRPQTAVAPRSFFKPSHTPMAPLPQRDGSEAGRAQLFLQRFGPVFRASTINPNSTGWIMFGRRVSEADLIATAYRKGFRAEAMAA